MTPFEFLIIVAALFSAFFFFVGMAKWFSNLIRKI